MPIVRILFVCAAVLVAGVAQAANRTVCSNGCQYSDLQAAIDAAVPGDTILLRAGQTFTGNFTLRNKNTSSTQYITIRSDAADSNFPAAGARLIPEGKSGWNTRRSALARLLGRGGTSKSTAVVRTAAGAHHYRLQFLELDGLNNLGYETLVDFGTSVGQTTSASVPHSFVVDRVWFHGHPTKGMKRGIYLNSGRTDILNSYFNDFFSFSDAQAICGTNGPGPYRIINNHLEAAAENILFGGEDPKIANLVPSDIEIRGNHFTKNLAWRNSILSTPGRPSVSSVGSGSLSAGTHYFKVTAVISAGGGNGYSLASSEASISVGSSGAVRLSWGAVSKADKYRIYRGTSSNGQSRYLETTSTSFTYTGSGETSGTPKTSATRWTAKNLLELKNAQRVTIDGNVMENNWSGFQQGYAIVLTPRNQSDTAPWSVVRDVTFTNNTVRNVAAVFNILGRDYNNPSQLTRNIRIANNVFENVSASWGNTGRFMVITEGPSGIVVDHNTIDHESVLVDVANGTVSGFVFTNNIARHNTYGIKGQDYASGNSTINAYFPGAIVRGNVLAGGPATWYPSGNYFPSAASFLLQFVNAAAGDWRLLSTSTYNNRATDGTDIGADIPAVLAAQSGEPPSSGGGGGTPSGPLPSGWQSRDIGSVGQPGSASADDGSFMVSGGGDDIWGTSDEFHFAYRSLTGNGSITAQVSSIIGAEPWTKAGVMIRASTASNAAHAFMFVSADEGLAFQRRRTLGGATEHTSGGSGTAPRWVQLRREGNTITALVSTTGSSWTTVGTTTMTLPSTALIGFAVTSHDSTRLATAAFDSATVIADGSIPAPATWDAGDIGAVGQPGSTSGSGSSRTVSGAGADIWDRADAFQYAYTSLAGDGTITAHVSSITGAMDWTKVGVMFRASTAANAAHAFMLVSTGKGLAFQRRLSSGALTSHTSGGSGTAPRWVRLTRRGDVITASVSTSGTSWTTVGSATIDLPSTALVGVAVSSHDPDRLATATFEDISVEQQ